MRNLPDILEDITDCEIALISMGDLGCHHANRLAALREEAKSHPDAAAGKDLPPIEGKIG